LQFGWESTYRMEHNALVPTVGVLPTPLERMIIGINMLDSNEVKFQKVTHENRHYLLITCRTLDEEVHIRVIDRDGIEDLKDFLT
jgi:hypothetical protein